MKTLKIISNIKNWTKQNFVPSKLLLLLSLVITSLGFSPLANANAISGVNYYSVPVGFNQKPSNNPNLQVYQNTNGDFILINSTSVGANNLNNLLDVVKKTPSNQLKGLATTFYKSFQDLKNVKVTDVKIKNIYSHNVLILYANGSLNNHNVSIPMFIFAGDDNRKIVGLVVSKFNGNYLLDQIINSIRIN